MDYQEYARRIGSEQTYLTAVIAAAMRVEPSCKGCHVCVADEETGVPLYLQFFGVWDSWKAQRTGSFVREKAVRLSSHPEHFLSFESQDPDNGQYGGAIRCAGVIFSVSGFTAAMDEAIAMVAAMGMRFLTPGTVKRMVAISHNPSIRLLEDQMVGEFLQDI